MASRVLAGVAAEDREGGIGSAKRRHAHRSMRRFEIAGMMILYSVARASSLFWTRPSRVLSSTLSIASTYT